MMKNLSSTGSLNSWVKKATVLTCLVASSALVQNASAQQLVPKWRSASAGVGTNRDMDYNPATGNLLLVQDGKVLRFKSSDGLSAGANLNISGVTGGVFLLSGLAVGSDGAIYGCNYVNATGTSFKLYRWANESAAPTVLFSTPYAFGGGIGAALSLYQSGTNVHFIAGGTATNALYIYHNGSDWASKTLAVDSQGLVSGAAFVDYNNGGSNEFRILAKTAANHARLFNLNPAATSPITLTTNRVYTAPLHFSLNGIHGVDYDPVTGLIGAATRAATTGFVYTNMLIATRGGAGTNLLNPVELSRDPLVATAGDGGNVGGVAWGTDGRLYTSVSAAGAGLHAYDVTAFLVSAPTDAVGNVGGSASLRATIGGSGLSYQWSKGGVPLTEGTKYSGVTSATLTINSLVLGDAALYTLDVVGVGASSVSTSGNVQVVNAPSPVTISSAEIIEGKPVIRFTGVPDRTYFIEGRTSLSSGTWQEVGSVLAPSNGETVFTDNTASGINVRFYRVVAQ